MRPHAFQIIQGVQGFLIEKVMAEVEGPYIQSQVGTAAMLLGQAMAELDDLVEALSGECARSDELLAGAAPLVDTALAAEIGAVRSSPPGLRISALIEGADRRRELLGRVLQRAESGDGALAALRPRIIEALRRIAAHEEKTGIFAR